MKSPWHLLIVFFTSFTILFYEIALIRIFSIVQWYDFAYFAISLALMGFGISGSFVFVLQNRIFKNADFSIYILNILFFLSLPVCFFLYLKVPFNALLVGLDNMQILYFIINTLLMLIPFFFGACIIIISLMLHQVDRVYFANLLGSGCGVACSYALMHLVHPFATIILILIILSFSIIISSLSYKRGSAIITFLIVTACIYLTYYSIEKNDIIPVSEYKSFSLVRNMPEFEVLAEKYSPQSLITIVKAKGLRKAGDLSYNYYGRIPEVYGMFFDYDNLSPLYKYDQTKQGLRDLEFLIHTPTGLAHHLLRESEPNESLILGTGGGSGIIRSLLTGFKTINAVEYNKSVIDLMQNKMAEYTGNIYNYERVIIHNIDARAYIETTTRTYSLIELEMLDSFVSSSSGVASLKEDYLYTINSFSQIWEIMDEDGILSITRWLKTPPRDSLKIINTIIDSLTEMGIKEPYRHIIAIRGSLSINILVFRSEVSWEKIGLTRDFCREKGFDPVYFPGIRSHETNIFFQERELNLYNSFISLFDKDLRNRFIRNYLFDIRSATDNKPYFFNFFKHPVIEHVIRVSGTKDLEFSQWGYFSIIIMLIPTALISLIFIFFPLLFAKQSIIADKMNISSLMFFFCIGIGFFFIEIVLIQKLILFLGHPVSSISIVIASVLVFSGFGSYFSNILYRNKLGFIPIILIIVFAIITLLTIDLVFIRLIQLNYIFKALISIAVLFPLSFFMGMPFPLTLSYIKKYRKGLVPWCWGVNGFASVNSIFLCSIVSIISGYNMVIICSVLIYLCAFLMSYIIRRSTG